MLYVVKSRFVKTFNIEKFRKLVATQHVFHFRFVSKKFAQNSVSSLRNILFDWIPETKLFSSIPVQPVNVEIAVIILVY